MFATVASARIIAYYTAWSTYGRNYQVSDIPFDKITHVNYAFANIGSDGRAVLGDAYADIDKFFPGDVWDTNQQPFRGNLWQLNRVAKRKFPHIKTLISVGGWTWSAKFSDVALTESSRRIFAESCKQLIDQYGFDGVDIDWEYPVLGGLPSNIYRPEDGKNYVLLLQALRQVLGTSKLLTIAAPAGVDKAQHLDVPGLARVLDFVNVMTYDYRGGWSGFTGHQTNLYAAPGDPDKEIIDSASSLDYYISKGMPNSKLVLGAAIYGRGWTGVSATNNGLFQKFTAVPQGTWDDGTSGLTGVFDYKDILRRVQSGQLKRYWDANAKAVYAYANGLMISYEDVESVREKCGFVRQKGMFGVMFWELSGDDRTTSLVATAFSALGSKPPSNTPPPAPAPSTPPPPPPPPTNNPGPGQMNCPLVTSKCTEQQVSCIGAQYARCSKGKWRPVSCPSGTTCAYKSRPICIRTNKLDSTTKVCSGTSPPSTPPSSSSCPNVNDKCKFQVDIWACIGRDLGQCGSSNQWSVSKCPAGTRCQNLRGQAFCQWESQIDSGAILC